MDPKPTTPEPTPLQKLQDFARRVLAVPKKEIDRKLAQEKSERKKASGVKLPRHRRDESA